MQELKKKNQNFNFWLSNKLKLSLHAICHTDPPFPRGVLVLLKFQVNSQKLGVQAQV